MSDLERRDLAGGGSEEDVLLLTRRRALAYLSWLLGAVISAALGLPLARFYIGGAFRKKKPRWVEVGSTSGIAAGLPALFRVSYIDQDGWRETTRREEVYAITENGRDFSLFSNVCPHLGCPVHWDERARHFLCPCHNGTFDTNGRVIHGPPPKPLARLEHKVDGGVLFVRVGD